MRDLAQVLDHDAPLPHPAGDPAVAGHSPTTIEF
jgi:hypothetical protein